MHEFSSQELLEALVRIQEHHTLEPVKRAIFAFAFLLARRKGESNPVNFFSTDPIREERWLSDILLPAEGSWHAAIRTYQDAGFSAWIDRSYFRQLDIAGCAAVLNSFSINFSPDELGPVLRNMGSWTNCVPVKWQPNERKKFVFGLPWLNAPAIEQFKYLMNETVAFWHSLNGQMREEITRLFRDQAWFFAGNQNRFVPPGAVFLFNPGDTRKLPDVAKEPREKHLEGLYQVFEIQTIEDTTDAANLKAQLRQMRLQADVSLSSGHTELYRSITLALSKLETDHADPGNIPVLYKTREGFAYRLNEPVWFAPAEFKKHKHIDPDLLFACFDDQINRKFVKALGVSLFQPRLRIDGERTEDLSLKHHLEVCYLPALFALAAEQLGSRLNREEVLERWQRLVIHKGSAIKLRVLMGQAGQADPDQAPHSNVLYIAQRHTTEDKLAVGELCHDLPEEPIEKSVHFSKFATPLADMVFRFYSLSETFAAYLDRAVLAMLKEQPLLTDELLAEKGINPEDIDRERLFIRSRLLDDTEWSRFLDRLRTFTGQSDITPEDWADLRWYEGPSLNFYDLSACFEGEDKLSSLLFQIDPRPGNKALLQRHFKRIQAMVYLCRRQVLTEADFHAHIAQAGNGIGLFRLRLQDASTWFAVRDPGEEAIQKAIWDIENGFTNLTEVSGTVSPVGATAATEPPAGTKAGHVDPGKQEEEQKKRRIRGLKVEKGVIRKYLQARDRARDPQTLAAIGEAMHAVAATGLRGDTVDQYLTRLDASLNVPEELTEADWEYFLHVADSIGDGLGYDILLPDWDTGGMICKVEVKSPSGNSKQIYLTDNERRMILKFQGDPSWRMWLNGIWDSAFSARVAEHIRLHNEQLKTLMSQHELYLVADAWIMKFD